MLKKILGLFLIFVQIPMIGWSVNETKRWIIDPLSNVAGIAPESTKEDLVRIFGEENVQRYEVPVGEGMTVEGTRIYGGTENEILIEWKRDTEAPERITIQRPGAKWKTKEGITIGTTLDQLEKSNGRSFMVTGFGWDYAGRSVSREGGKLPPQLQLDFDYIRLSPKEESQVRGEGPFLSNHPIMKKKALKVQTLYIRW